VEQSRIGSERIISHRKNVSWTRVSRVEGSVRTQGEIDAEAKGRKGKIKRIIGK